MSTAESCSIPFVHRPVLFDLDGTITDSAPIITQCFAETMEKLSGWDYSPDFYSKYVGPPLRDSFAEMVAMGDSVDTARYAAETVALSHVDDDVVDTYVRQYREFYFERMLGTPCFPGMDALLRRLHAAGVPMVVATSKRVDAATLLLEHVGLADVFLQICGSPEGEEGTKADRVAEGLAAFRARGIDCERAIMVGDRYFDTRGAAEHGIPTVLVTWGEGTAEEYAEAWATADTMEELEELLLA